MIQIYYSAIKQKITRQDMDKICRFFNNEMIMRMERSNSDFSKIRRFTLMNMLIELCQRLHLPNALLATIYHNEYGKLLMPNYNIQVSYSGEFVFCMISRFRVGLDVELVNPGISYNAIKMYNHFFGTNILEYMTFFKEWTRTESLVKYFDNKGIKGLIFNKADSVANSFKTVYKLFHKSYMVAVSAPEFSKRNRRIILKLI